MREERESAPAAGSHGCAQVCCLDSVRLFDRWRDGADGDAVCGRRHVSGNDAYGHYQLNQPHRHGEEAVVHDLQTLNNNAQFSIRSKICPMTTVSKPE